jgi:hypothetical protein
MSLDPEGPRTNRRQFVGRTAATGAGILVGGSGLDALVPSLAAAKTAGVTKADLAIIATAQIAEALAVTTYSNIIDRAPFFRRLPSDDRGYVRAAREEEMSHYLLEKSLTGKPSPLTTFYYPPKMFADAQTTLNVLVSLEEAFIAAYLVAVRNFDMPELCVTAARIMGVESDHRTLARVLARDVSAQDGGPIKRLMGFQGEAESVDPPNNNGYERTFGWTKISDVVAALMPFADQGSAGTAGFDASKPYRFKPFRPKLPEPSGGFHSFIG